jgi:hypothetical protein
LIAVERNCTEYNITIELSVAPTAVSEFLVVTLVFSNLASEARTTYSPSSFASMLTLLRKICAVSRGETAIPAVEEGLPVTVRLLSVTPVAAITHTSPSITLVGGSTPLIVTPSRRMKMFSLHVPEKLMTGSPPRSAAVMVASAAPLTVHASADPSVAAAIHTNEITTAIDCSLRAFIASLLTKLTSPD